MRTDPFKQFFVCSAGQHPLLKSLGVDPEKLDEILIESHRDVVVILNFARMPKTNLVDKPTKVSDATEKSFGATRIRLLSHGSNHTQE